MGMGGCAPVIPDDPGDGTVTPSTSYTISGYVRDASEAGIANVTITSDDGSSTTTDSEGSWSLADLEGTHTITPSRSSWRFEPTSSAVTVASNAVDFLGTSLPTYPETESFPTLVFSWIETGTYGALDLTSDTSGDIYGCIGFSSDVDGAGSLDWSLLLANRQREPIYAICSGTITYVSKWNDFTTASATDSGGEVWVRHGQNYAVVYRHVVTSGAGLAVGQTVEQGGIVGYTADRGDDGSLYQFGLAQKQDMRYAWLNPYVYFDSTSRTQLTVIWNVAQQTDMAGYTEITQPWGDLSVFVLSDSQEVAQRGGLE